MLTECYTTVGNEDAIICRHYSMYLEYAFSDFCDVFGLISYLTVCCTNVAVYILNLKCPPVALPWTSRDVLVADQPSAQAGFDPFSLHPICSLPLNS